MSSSLISLHLRHGDCIEKLKELGDGAVSAVITDPPYLIGFMSKEWDKADDSMAFHKAWLVEALRVLKPGGLIKAFTGTGTKHHLEAAVEDVGFELVGEEAWGYGQGFPKSLNISKAVDKHLGAVREVVGSKMGLPGYRAGEQVASTVLKGGVSGALNNGDAKLVITAPSTSEAALLEGWGTALKPGWEPFVVGRKPPVPILTRRIG